MMPKTTNAGSGPTRRWAQGDRRARRRVVAFVLLLLAALPALAARPISFRRLSHEQGLSQATVLSILQDSRGFMWFGTEDGLNRYDGYSMKVYEANADDPASLPDDSIWAIVEDRDGDLWIGTESAGVARWERSSDSFVRYPFDGVVEGGWGVRALVFDRHDRLWIGTESSGLLRFDPESGEIDRWRHDPSDPNSLSDDTVYGLVELPSGDLWVGTDYGVDRWIAETGELAPQLPATQTGRTLQTRALLLTTDGSLWLGTRTEGLLQLEPRTGEWRRYRNDPRDPDSLADNDVRAVYEDRDGRLWVGTVQGLELWAGSGNEFAHYRHDPAVPTSLSGNYVRSIFQDRGGVLWVGISEKGLNRWKPVTWSFGHVTVDPSDPKGLNESSIVAFAEDRAGLLWVGTFGGGLNRMNRVTGEVGHYRHDPADQQSLSSDRVTALLHDSRGLLWVGTYDGGLNRLDPASGKVERFVHDPQSSRGLSAEGIMALHEDARGDIWVGTFGGGLNRFRYGAGRGGLERFGMGPSDPAPFRETRVTALATDDAGALWFGTDPDGLGYYRERTGTYRSFLHESGRDDSLSSNRIFSLYLEPSGRLWIGTSGGGLNLLEGLPEPSERASFRRYSEADGLPDDVVYGIEPDHHGNLWLSTNNGLAELDPRTGAFKTFDLSHGIQGKEFNFGAHYASPSGELFFGGPNGFNAFFPDRLQRRSEPPPVVLTAFLKLNQPVDLDRELASLDSVELDYRDDVVTFEFAALDYTSPERNRYAYMLEGFDEQWIQVENIRRVTYTNLDPGTYTLRIKGANSDGVWNEEGLAISMRVEPPPWRSWWAYLLYGVLAVAALGLLLAAQRRKKAREIEYTRKLEREVQERTAQLTERNSQLTDLNRRLQDASLTDPLTGLRNRRYLFELVVEEIALLTRRHAAAARSGRSVPSEVGIVFLMLDLDNFKSINDTYGHKAGDEVLLQVRDVLKETSRASDTLVRWGGDEFLIIGRDSSATDAERMAERICSRLDRHAIALEDARVVQVTCSIGFASFPFIAGHPELFSWEDTLALADAALYSAKRSSRNAWVGLDSTDIAPSQGSLSSLRAEPSRLVEEGLAVVLTSIGEERQLLWQ